MGFWGRVLVNTVLFVAIAGFFAQSGAFYVTSIWMAFVASLVLAILNALVKPILFVLSLPITVMTLGLFSIVLNAAMLQLTSYFVGSANFHFSSFGSRFWWQLSCRFATQLFLVILLVIVVKRDIL